MSTFKVNWDADIDELVDGVKKPEHAAPDFWMKHARMLEAAILPHAVLAFLRQQETEGIAKLAGLEFNALNENAQRAVIATLAAMVERQTLLGHATDSTTGDFFGGDAREHQVIFAPTRRGMTDLMVTGLAPGQLANVTKTEKPE